MQEIDVTKKLPEKSIRAGPVKVSVWRNKTEEGRPYYSVSFEKQYLDEESDEWKTSSSLMKNDIPKAILALQEAYRYLVLHRSGKDILDDMEGEEFFENPQTFSVDEDDILIYDDEE